MIISRKKYSCLKSEIEVLQNYVKILKANGINANVKNSITDTETFALKREIELLKSLNGSLKQKCDELESLIPYKEKLKKLSVRDLRDIARNKYGISENEIQANDNSAELIESILHAKEKLEKL